MKKNVAIELINISKRYYLNLDRPTLVETSFTTSKRPEFWALRNINLTIKKGERLAVIGPNGAGKSTLLEIIAGITHPTSGTVFRAGKVVSLLKLTAGFQMELIGVENIYLNGLLIGMSRQDIKSKIDKIIKFADIGRFIHQPFHTYSNGMQLRLAFSIALFSDPDIFIMDEIISVGDSSFRDKCLNLLFKQNTKKTIIFASHNISEVSSLSQRTIKIEGGEIFNHKHDAIVALVQNMPINYTYKVRAVSGSMYPAIHINDVITIQKTDFAKLKVDDVVAFMVVNIPEIIIHRIINIIGTNNQKQLVTKGDNSNTVDSWVISQDQYLGVVTQINT